jgi:hypothetical protein
MVRGVRYFTRLIARILQAEWLASRREDPGLSPDGLKQTVKLAKHFASSDIVHDIKRFNVHVLDAFRLLTS